MLKDRLVAAATITLLALVPVLAATASTAQSQEPLALRLVYFYPYAAFEAAQELGYVAQERLAVTAEVTPSSTVQMQGLVSGRWDIGITAFDNLLASRTREGEQSVAYGVAERITLSLMARPEIARYEDLRGRPLAADAVDTAFALVLRRLLLAHDLDLARGDYELVAVGGQPERLQSLLRGDTFASILASPTDVQAEQEGLHRLGQHSEVLPDYPGSVFASTATWLSAASNRDAAIRFLRAWQRGATWVSNPANRDAAIALLMRRQSLPERGAIAAVDAVLPSAAIDPGGLATVRNLRAGLGLAVPANPIEEYYDLSIYQLAVR